MNRQQKEEVVAQFKEMLGASQAVFLVNYKGLGVAPMQSLRRKLREQGAKLKVTKARLMKLSVGEAEEMGEFKNYLKNQVGLVFVQEDVPGVAKTIVEFAKGKEISFEVISGFFESKVMTAQEVNFLASIPSKDVLLAQLANVLQAPIASFARALNMIVEKLKDASEQVAEKKEQSV